MAEQGSVGIRGSSSSTSGSKHGVVAGSICVLATVATAKHMAGAFVVIPQSATRVFATERMGNPGTNSFSPCTTETVPKVMISDTSGGEDLQLLKGAAGMSLVACAALGVSKRPFSRRGRYVVARRAIRMEKPKEIWDERFDKPFISWKDPEKIDGMSESISGLIQTPLARSAQMTMMSAQAASVASKQMTFVVKDAKLFGDDLNIAYNALNSGYENIREQGFNVIPFLRDVKVPKDVDQAQRMYENFIFDTELSIRNSNSASAKDNKKTEAKVQAVKDVFTKSFEFGSNIFFDYGVLTGRQTAMRSKKEDLCPKSVAKAKAKAKGKQILPGTGGARAPPVGPLDFNAIQQMKRLGFMQDPNDPSIFIEKVVEKVVAKGKKK